MTENIDYLDQTWNKLFKEYSIPELRNIEKDLEKQTARKKQSLRTLVGSRYRHLLSTADTIIEMNNSIRDEHKMLSNIALSDNKWIMDMNKPLKFNEDLAKQYKYKISDSFQISNFISILGSFQRQLTLSDNEINILCIVKLIIFTKTVFKNYESNVKFSQLFQQLNAIEGKLMNRINKLLTTLASNDNHAINLFTAYSLLTNSSTSEILKHFSNLRLSYSETILKSPTADYKSIINTLIYTHLTISKIIPTIFSGNLQQFLIKELGSNLFIEKDYSELPEIDFKSIYILEDINPKNGLKISNIVYSSIISKPFFKTSLDLELLNLKTQFSIILFKYFETIIKKIESIEELIIFISHLLKLFTNLPILRSLSISSSLSSDSFLTQSNNIWCKQFENLLQLHILKLSDTETLISKVYNNIIENNYIDNYISKPKLNKMNFGLLLSDIIYENVGSSSIINDSYQEWLDQLKIDKENLFKMTKLKFIITDNYLKSEFDDSNKGNDLSSSSSTTIKIIKFNSSHSIYLDLYNINYQISIEFDDNEIDLDYDYDESEKWVNSEIQSLQSQYESLKNGLNDSILHAEYKFLEYINGIITNVDINNNQNNSINHWDHIVFLIRVVQDYIKFKIQSRTDEKSNSNSINREHNELLQQTMTLLYSSMTDSLSQSSIKSISNLIINRFSDDTVFSEPLEYQLWDNVKINDESLIKVPKYPSFDIQLILSNLALNLAKTSNESDEDVKDNSDIYGFRTFKLVRKNIVNKLMDALFKQIKEVLSTKRIKEDKLMAKDEAKDIKEEYNLKAEDKPEEIKKEGNNDPESKGNKTEPTSDKEDESPRINDNDDDQKKADSEELSNNITSQFSNIPEKPSFFPQNALQTFADAHYICNLSGGVAQRTDELLTLLIGLNSELTNEVVTKTIEKSIAEYYKKNRLLYYPLSAQ